MALTANQIAKVKDAIKETQRMLDKAQLYSYDLQKPAQIEFYQAHIAYLTVVLNGEMEMSMSAVKADATNWDKTRAVLDAEAKQASPEPEKVERHQGAVISRMVAEYFPADPSQWSDADIDRGLSGCVAAKKLIAIAKAMRSNPAAKIGTYPTRDELLASGATEHTHNRRHGLRIGDSFFEPVSRTHFQRNPASAVYERTASI